MRKCVLAALVAAAVPAGVFAQIATVSYEGVVTRSSGPQAASVVAGEPIRIAYSVDTRVSDANSSPAEGVFPSGLVALRVEFPARAIAIEAGTGMVQTFDDVVVSAPEAPVLLSDQAFFYSFFPRAGSTFGGETVQGLEVDFIDTPDSTTSAPVMLASDAMPTTALATADTFVTITSPSGNTRVSFVAAPPVGPSEVVAVLRRMLSDGLGEGRLGVGFATALRAQLVQVTVALDASDRVAACAAVRVFLLRLDVPGSARQADPASREALRESATELQRLLGC